MTKVSLFFAELSEDNSSISSLLTPEVVTFIKSLKDILSPENCEFVINMSIFYYNAVTQGSSVASLTSNNQDVMAFLTQICSSVMKLNNSQSPQQHFLEHFSEGFEKIMDAKDDAKNDEINDKDVVFDDEDEEQKMEEENPEDAQHNIASKPIDNKQTETL